MVTCHAIPESRELKEKIYFKKPLSYLDSNVREKVNFGYKSIRISDNYLLHKLKPKNNYTSNIFTRILTQNQRINKSQSF